MVLAYYRGGGVRFGWNERVEPGQALVLSQQNALPLSSGDELDFVRESLMGALD